MNVRQHISHVDFQKRADLCVELPNVRMISRVYPEDGFPQLRDQKFAVFVGVHKVVKICGLKLKLKRIW